MTLRILCMLITTNLCLAEDVWIIISIQGHEAIVEPYLEARYNSTVPTLDDRSVEREAATQYPFKTLPVRGEFESMSAFQKREDDIDTYNKQMLLKRDEFIQKRESEHLSRAKEAAKWSARKNALASKQFEKLYVMYPTKAPRYDYDTMQYGPLLLPESILGKVNYGIAEMTIDAKPSSFTCSDIKIATQIRSVSDKGNLWCALVMSDAVVSITEGTAYLPPGIMEESTAILKNSGKIVGAFALAALQYAVDPNITTAPYIPQMDSASLRSAPQISIHISAKNVAPFALYDASADKFFYEFPVLKSNVLSFKEWLKKTK